MNDVLPKPFTKEGLLNMLEKHLGHLKKMPDGLDVLPNTASSLNATTSLKDEASPGQSSATLSNWNSPSQFPGISPAGSNPYIPPANTQYAMEQGSMQYQQPSPISAGPRGAGHRRQVSEITADEMGSDPKRARIYATTNTAINQMRRI